MRYKRQKKRLPAGMAAILLCAALCFSTKASGYAAEEKMAELAEMDNQTASDWIITLLGEESSNSGCIYTGILYGSDQRVREFADYFYQIYYNGSCRVQLGYVTRSDQPGLYEVVVISEKPQEAARQQRFVESKLEQVASDIGGQADHDKAMGIYRWIYDYFEYDYSYEINDVYSSLQTGKTVCNGYTRLFERLCAYKGLKCEIITSQNHAWNRVMIDGQWKYVDITWNKNIGEDKWLFLTKEEMDLSHKASGG